MTDTKVSLEELEEAIYGSTSIQKLIDNLHNLQRREGGTKQLFDTQSKGVESNLQKVVRNLKEIQMACEEGEISYHALDPRFQKLPNGVREKAQELAKKELEK